MLNDARIRHAAKKAKPYKLTDDKGLYIEVRPNGAKYWRYRYRIEGKENVFTIGEYFREAATPGHVSLEEARKRRAAARELVRQGTHPAQQRDASKAAQQAQNANTFESVARDWLAESAKRWTVRHGETIKRALEGEVFPDIGALPIRSEAEVFAAAILRIMKRVEKYAPVKAISLRQWCSAVFSYGVRNLRAGSDPTTVLRGAVIRPDIKHKNPLTKDQIPQLVRQLVQGTLRPETRIALQLLMLLFVRPSELRKAEWTEFDLERGEWRIPAERMKKRELHVVPLPPQAVALLRELHELTGEREYLFPNVRRPKACMSETTLNQVLWRLGYYLKFSAHGFRATATSLLHEFGYPEHLIELSLAHKERNATKAAYNQYQYFAERRDLMNTWAGMVDQWAAGGNVVPIRRSAA
jgi:integrase